MGLLDPNMFDNPFFQAGAGIMGNNWGHYGAFGPAVGGGLAQANAMRRNTIASQQALAKLRAEQKQREALEKAIGQLPEDMRPFVRAGAPSLYNKAYPAESNTYYGTPLFDKNNNAFVIGKDGSVKAVAPPGGGQFQPPAKFLDLGNTQLGVNPRTGERISQYPVQPKPGEMPSFQADQETAKGRAKTAVELERNKPKEDEKLAQEEFKYSMLTDLIDEVYEAADYTTVGVGGGLTKNVWMTPGHDLAKQLDTIKSNLGFDKLQSMRDQSPTGGALGQVSEFENRLLQSVWGSLAQTQSPEQFKKNLIRVKDTLDAIIHGRRDAYYAKYGVRIDPKAEFQGSTGKIDRSGQKPSSEFDELWGE